MCWFVGPIGVFVTLPDGEGEGDDCTPEDVTLVMQDAISSAPEPLEPLIAERLMDERRVAELEAEAAAAGTGGRARSPCPESPAPRFGAPRTKFQKSTFDFREHATSGRAPLSPLVSGS